MPSSVCQSRLVVAISGGVDSSVAAYLLSRQLMERSGKRSSAQTDPCRNSKLVERSTHASQLIGMFMNNWDSSDEDGSHAATSFCVHTEKEWHDANAVCSLLQLPLCRANFSSEYWTEVFTPFLQSMPNSMLNPDMLCNSVIKFGSMKNYALQRLNASCIATGHYARLWRRQREEWMEEWTDDIRGFGIDVSCGRPTLQDELYATGTIPDWVEHWGKSRSNGSVIVPPLLVAGADSTKDQSYFLSMTPGVAFRNVLFPLGYLQKQNHTTVIDVQRQSTENKSSKIDDSQSSFSVRDIAAQAGLPVANKKDSSGICFIGKRRFPDFISGYLPLDVQKEGNFVCIDTGEVVGTHKGCAAYTIGQGARISGATQKWFVIGKDPKHSVVYVCCGTHHPSLYTNELYLDASLFNWIGGEIPSPLLASPSRSLQGIYCRIRHLQPLVECEVTYNRNLSTLRVNFHLPIRAVTPGQTAALYTAGGLLCLGGGPIRDRGPSYQELGIPLPPILHPSGHNDWSVYSHQEKTNVEQILITPEKKVNN